MSLPNCLNLTAHIDHSFGGLTTSLPEYCAALQGTRKYRTQLAAFCEPGEKAAGAEDVTIFPFGRKRWYTDSALRQSLAKLIGQADAVHIHGLWQEQTAFGSAFAQRARKPYLVSAHGMLEPWAFQNKGWKKRLYWHLLEKRYLNGASCLRALTSAEAQDYRNMGLRTPIAIIPNGVTAPATIDPALFFERFPELRGKTIVLFLGRLHPKKGLAMLCKSWSGVCAAYSEAHLVIAGPDSAGQQQSLQQLVAGSGIESRVTFAGMLRGGDKWAALRAASFFTLPSYSEGFSISVLEALAAGTPVLLSRQCYFPEVATYRCGFTIEPEPAPLEAALRECLELSPADRAAMGLRARQLADERFTWPIVGAQSAAVLDWLLGGGPAPAGVEMRA